MQTRPRVSCLVLAVVVAALPLGAQEPVTGAAPTAAPAPAPPRFGPFEALVFDATVLQDVKVENGRIYLKLQPEQTQKEILLRNSSLPFDAYRKWFNDSFDLVAPADAGRALNAWTDWVETTGTYVEYWMEGRLFLHLHRVEP